MNKQISNIIVLLTLSLLASSNAWSQGQSDDDLKIAAIEALMTAPSERSLPIVKKVLAGNHSTEVKERALFILSQTDAPESQRALLEFAANGDSELQIEAIRMIGIGGDDASLSELRSIYDAGSASVRGAVLEAFLIAGDPEAVLEIAENAEGRDFEEAVEMLGVMGASEQLRGLLGRPGATQALIEAYAIAGDFETLREMALDDSNHLMQVRAIEALGIVGGDSVDQTLMEIYRSANNKSIRDASLHGMLVADYDEGVLELYKSSDSADEKKQLLQMLVIMDSEAVWDIVDTALDGGV